MVLKLYGSAMATSRVLVVILELGLEYEYIPIDISKGEQKTGEYMQKQPWGKVPVLEDDGFLMHESRAICKYLVAYVLAQCSLMCWNTYFRFFPQQVSSQGKQIDAGRHRFRGFRRV